MLTPAATAASTPLPPASGAEPRPGRTCPLHYHYGPDVFAAEAPPALSGLDTLIVAGGLYGNGHALDALLRLADGEHGRSALLFNGDFHWFDVEPARFARVQNEVLAHHALRGNVETELADEGADGDAGCGCAYPDWVGDGVVDRSNRILRRLREATTAPQRAALAALPMWLRADVGPLRLGVVHGDAQSLAGWGFAQEHLREASHREQARQWFARAGVDAFACTHTCLPVFQALRTGAGERWVLNNGAAGMPNFGGDAAGLAIRISTTPCPGPIRRFGVRVGDLFVDAIALEVDAAAVQRTFLAAWPEGSDAHLSYFDRIRRGPDYRLDDAIRRED